MPSRRRVLVSYTRGVSSATLVQRVAPVVFLFFTTCAALIVGLLWGGGAAPLALIDAGALVRYGLPISQGVLRLASTMTLGALLVAAFALPRTDSRFEQLLRVASWASGVWVLASLSTATFVFLTVYAEPVRFDDRFGNLMALFLGSTELGRSWLWSTVLAAAVSVLSVLGRSYPAVFLTGLLGVAALWPVAEQGHAAGTASHTQAVMAGFLHTTFLAFWVGGLIAFTLVWSSQARDHENSRTLLERFSTIALVSALVVGVSGVVNASTRMTEWSHLTTPYGLLVVTKAIVFTVLLAFGALYRVRLLRQWKATASGSSVLRRVLLSEVGIMGVAIGFAVALSRTPPPAIDLPATERQQATPAEILTGKPLPPEFDWTTIFTVWQLDLLWALLVGFGIFFYLAGVIRLQRRGDHWPIGRTVAWVAGLLALGFTTQSGLAVYGMYLFSVHMMGHMALSMVIPIVLVLAAPVTLAARAIEGRRDGSWGPRDWILHTVNSRYVEIIGHPLVAAPLFALSLILFYYSPLFDWALRDHLGHQWMTFHFLLSGYLFAQVLVGVDPHPHRPAYPLRLILTLATMAFHAFFGLSLIQGEGLLVPEWYGAMGREWGLPPLDDQQQGGEIAWSVGEIPTLLLAILIAWAWSRQDARETKRLDRQAERDDDEALRAYNEMLGALAKAEAKRTASRSEESGGPTKPPR